MKAQAAFAVNVGTAYGLGRERRNCSINERVILLSLKTAPVLAIAGRLRADYSEVLQDLRDGAMAKFGRACEMKLWRSLAGMAVRSLKTACFSAPAAGFNNSKYGSSLTALEEEKKNHG